MAFYKYSAPSNTFKALGSAGVAGEISFDNSGTSLTSTNVQNAVVEIGGKVYEYEERTFTSAADALNAIVQLNYMEQALVRVKRVITAANGTIRTNEVYTNGSVYITDSTIADGKTFTNFNAPLTIVSLNRVDAIWGGTDSDYTSSYWELNITPVNAKVRHHYCETTSDHTRDIMANYDVSSITMLIPEAVADD